MTEQLIFLSFTLRFECLGTWWTRHVLPRSSFVLSVSRTWTKCLVCPRHLWYLTNGFNKIYSRGSHKTNLLRFCEWTQKVVLSSYFLIYIQIYVYMNERICEHTFIHIYIYEHRCMYIYMYIICIYICI